MTFASHIEPEELNALPLSSFEGKIHVVDTPEAINAAVQRLRRQAYLGFDTETRPSFKKGKVNPVSLLQLATRDEAYLFRLNKTGNHAGLGRLLSDEKVLKIGAAIHEDTRTLRTIFPHEAKGFIDLQEMVKDYGIENFGIKKLAAIVLGIRISKSQQLSNWEADILTEAQLSYAATDAWVALEIFLKLRQSQPK
jgi:ribonuclease D